MAAPRRCAVVGRPITHSLSPVMHRAAYDALGLDWSYEALDVGPGGLTAFTEHLDEAWRGLSVTMPLKREAAELAVHRSDDVTFLGVANTLVREHDGWHASNTDVPGALTALREAGVECVRHVRVLGGGATAASLVLAAHRLGASRVSLHLREPARAAETLEVARALGMEVDVVGLETPVLDPVDLLVNTIPPTATAGRSHELVEASGAVFEALYDPWPSPLLRAAEEEGLPACSGLDLLVHQAVLQVVAMTGQVVDPQVLRAPAFDAVAAR
ncbi:shikimate dehydrogenase [Aeromicrobium phragmitis]|uniref:Shikimate dehydrogenase n=1 Tax=Aeromicrobium phragmitis TaxID=2478914 RepID=A0A3L8PMZ5_9ACTN|nr:shikimate dehydrogenase [Aeromicrobium phragmitis]RLV55412.1 shikimate dehydrogenase [Aeromicrobium phragmitis]